MLTSNRVKQRRTDVTIFRSAAMLIIHAILRVDLTLPRHRIQKISGFVRPHGSKLFGDSKLSTLESGFKKLRIRMRIRRICVDERRINPEKKSCGFKNIRIRVDGA